MIELHMPFCISLDLTIMKITYCPFKDRIEIFIFSIFFLLIKAKFVEEGTLSLHATLTPSVRGA